MQGGPRYRSPQDLPRVVPIFPLRGAIVLPRAVLPLNIFEPRYLAMVDAALKRDRVIGMIQPVGSSGPTGSPLERDAALRKVGCIGRITAFQERDDGRLLITLSGVIRFRPVEEHATTEPFRELVVDCEPFQSDLVPGLGVTEVNRTRLLGVLKDYLDRKKLAADWTAIQQAETERLVNALSVLAPYGTEEKQALIEARTLPERAELLTALAEMELAVMRGGGPSTNLQ